MIHVYFSRPSDFMQIYPSTGLEIIEFNKILSHVSGHCLSVQAKQAALEITPFVEPNEIRDQLAIVGDALEIISNESFAFGAGIPPVEKILNDLRVVGFVLGAEEIGEIKSLLVSAASVFDFFEEEKQLAYPNFYGIASQVPDVSEWIKAVDAIINEEGEVRPDASQVLKNISREIDLKRREGDKVFQSVVRKYSKDGWLADTLESVRNDRRVLAVKAEYKRKIRGIVHDQSATGKTAFVEPEEIIGLNNDLFDLHSARRAEEYRLLAELCNVLRPHADVIEIVEQILVEMDLYFAKARLGRDIDGTIPTVLDKPDLGLKFARHPLLLMKNSRERKETVPFDLDLHGANRLLLLSGPNAGGKSILMKSVGLLQVMVQSGIPVSTEASAEFGVFNKLCVELGDRQSIEDDLSTYSSRLLDMKQFLEVSDSDTLLLIDEFGSGTDPKLGGAIAEALLDSFHKKQVSGVLTTHYSELKVYAFKKKGVLNGAMIFDKEKMASTYKLMVGKPGSSFTFEIAEQTGLPKSILAYAREKAGKNTQALEDLLRDLEAKTHKLDIDLADLTNKQRNADRLIKNYDQMREDLAVQRKRFKLEQKERDYQHLSRLNKELEKAVRIAKEEKNAEKAKKQLAKVKKEREKARSSITNINDDLSKRSVQEIKKDWAVGDPVRIRGGEHTGKIELLDRKKATVIVGQLRMTVSLKDLIPAGEPLQINPTVSIQSNVTAGSGFNSLLDLRGMRVHEAHKLLEKFIDAAYLADAHMLRIVHGKGTGALKSMVEKTLRDYSVESIEQPEDKQGGAGATIVTL